jgi:hypothetical protein
MVSTGYFYPIFHPTRRFTLSTPSLSALAAAVATLPDPRSKQGVSHPYHGMLLLVLLGLLAQIPEMARIYRWVKKHWQKLREPLNFKKDHPPVATTISRALEKTTVADLQNIFADFMKTLLAEEHDFIAAAVDGKVAKQMKDEDGDPILRLNIFAHNIKGTLRSYNVHGDKTNEPGCLKTPLEELFDQYPMLKLLTGDAIFAQRPLLEVLQKHGCDYLFQIKDNQSGILEAAKTCFADIDPDAPDYRTPAEKKTAMSKCERLGSIEPMPSMFANS